MSKEKSNGVESTPIEQSKEGTEQVKDRVLEVSSPYNTPKKNSPKHSQSKWIQCRTAYERGDFNSVRELGDRFGIKEFTLHSRINREGWKEKKEQLLARVQSTLEKQVVKQLTAQDSYLLHLNARSEKYERMLDASVSQLATTNNGVPLCEPSDLDTLSRSEIRVMEMRKTALKIVNTVDVLSNGQGLGDSFISAIAKLRQDPSQPALSQGDLSKVLEAEVE